MRGAANAGVRDYVIFELTVLGLRPEQQTVEVPAYFDESGAAVEVVNVMARTPGEHPWLNDVGLVVNLEAAGGFGPSMLGEASGPGTWIIEGLAGAVPRTVASS